MHQLILITALSATTGIFGGKHCGKVHHGKRAAVASCYSSTYYGATYAMPQTTPQGMAVPSAKAYPMTPPVPYKMAPPAPSVPAAPPTPTPSAGVTTTAPAMIGNE